MPLLNSTVTPAPNFPCYFSSFGIGNVSKPFLPLGGLGWSRYKTWFYTSRRRAAVQAILSWLERVAASIGSKRLNRGPPVFFCVVCQFALCCRARPSNAGRTFTTSSRCALPGETIPPNAATHLREIENSSSVASFYSHTAASADVLQFVLTICFSHYLFTTRKATPHLPVTSSTRTIQYTLTLFCRVVCINPLAENSKRGCEKYSSAFGAGA